MGITHSKSERSSALNICKGRTRFIKQAIHSRNALAAAHVSYVQSLRNIGIALRRFAEAEVFVENSPSASAMELDKTPSHSSYPSLLMSRSGDVSDLSSINNSLPFSSNAIVSQMRSSGASALTVRVSPPPTNADVEEGEFSMPPPPPPPPEPRSSWDYFDPHEESYRFMGQIGTNIGPDDARMYGSFGKNDVVLGGIHEGTPINEHGELVLNNGKVEDSGKEVNGSNLSKNASFVEKDICEDREDASEIIPHTAKDFVSSIMDIDNSLVRASESGKEVSRMLESSKIQIGYAQAKGTPRTLTYLASFGASCLKGRAADVSDDQNVTNVITWKRTSTRSSSSKNHTRVESDDNGRDFIGEFCMISGSHSSTLDRLYAWERKLYDEVKASKSIHKEYDRKCDQLRHQFAKDLSPQIIDKTRAVTRDLHSRIRVGLHAVDSISKRIEKMRDEELLPQLLELIQGLTKMWKTMLECHHSQYITISSSYHAKSPAISFHGETQRQIITHLLDELEYFGLSFANLINSYTSFVEALNSWLQICILPPRERHKGRRAFSPRRYLAPQIFVLCRDWSAGIKSLPSNEVSYAIKGFIWELRRFGRPQPDELLRKELESNEDRSLNVRCVQDSLMKVFDKLSKISEASVKICEDVLKKCEAARNAYESYKVQPRTYSN